MKDYYLLETPEEVTARIGSSEVGNGAAWKFNYEPGNGTRYEMVIARFGDELFVGIPNFRSSYCFTKPEHWPYVGEKLRLSRGDAEEVTKVINACFR